MGRLHVDFLGPLSESTAGNTNKLVIVDLFTKLVECVPLPSQTAEVTASEAMYIFFARFSFPSTSSQTKAENLKANFSNPYSQTSHNVIPTFCQSQVESFNKTIMDAARCFVGKSMDNLDEHLPQLAGAIRSYVNRNTSFTPNYLMLGRGYPTSRFSISSIEYRRT